MRSNFFKDFSISKIKIDVLLAINLALALLLLSISLLLQLSAEPPLQSFERARKAVARARNCQADLYAKDLLLDAEMNLNLAHLAWARENRRWMINREFYLTHEYCKKATIAAERAATRAVAVRDSLRWLTHTGIKLLREQLNQMRSQLTTMPVQNELRQKIAMGELLLLESEEAFRRQDFRRAAACYSVALTKIGTAGEEIKAALHSYFADHWKWRHWVEETLNWSVANNDLVILVDKLAHRCYVFEGGIKIAEYPVELGPHWLGNKIFRGDGATPEGRYYIRKKKSDKQTVYYKALEIDYPNQEDQARFFAAQRSGRLSEEAAIGGGIEIHGDGGKGADWTAGCIALRNEDMDSLFDRAKIGTPVTIVGSLRDIPLITTNGTSSTLVAQ